MKHSPSLPHAGDTNAMAQRLIRRAHHRDGLPEIAMGLSFLLVSVLVYAQAALPRESIGYKATAIAFAVLVPVLCFGAPGALRWVRRRYLIERAGYVQSKPIDRRRIVFGIVSATLVVLALIGVVTWMTQPDPWVLAGTGLFGGALLAWFGRLPRFLVNGVAIAATGMCVALAGVSLEPGFAILFGFQGLLTLVSGCAVFRQFVRQPIETGE